MGYAEFTTKYSSSDKLDFWQGRLAASSSSIESKTNRLPDEKNHEKKMIRNWQIIVKKWENLQILLLKKSPSRFNFEKDRRSLADGPGPEVAQADGRTNQPTDKLTDKAQR